MLFIYSKIKLGTLYRFTTRSWMCRKQWPVSEREQHGISAHEPEVCFLPNECHLKHDCHLNSSQFNRGQPLHFRCKWSHSKEVTIQFALMQAIKNSHAVLSHTTACSDISAVKYRFYILYWFRIFEIISILILDIRLPAVFLAVVSVTASWNTAQTVLLKYIVHWTELLQNDSHAHNFQHFCGQMITFQW